MNWLCRPLLLIPLLLLTAAAPGKQKAKASETEKVAPPVEQKADDKVSAREQAPDKEEKKRGMRIAVYNLDAATVDVRIARVVTESLLAELRKLERVSVIGFDEIQAMLNLEAEKQMMGCEADNCLAEIADAIGADVLVTGTLAQVGDDHVIALKRISQTDARAVGSFTRRVPAGKGEEFLAEVGPAVEELFLDFPLRSGAHRGVEASAARRLSPPPLPDWTLPLGVASSAVLLAAAGVAGALQLVFQTEFSALAASSASEVVDGTSLVAAGGRAQSAEVAGWTLLASGLTLAVATATAVPFIDFEHENDTANAGVAR